MAHVVTHQHSRVSIFNTLKNLDLLPISWRIDYKVPTLTCKVLETGQPLYLASRIDIIVPHRILRSSADTQLLAASPSKTKIGSIGFRYSAPSIWTHLPFDIYATPFLQIYKNEIKTFYFQQAFNWFNPDLSLNAPQIRFFVSMVTLQHYTSLCNNNYYYIAIIIITIIIRSLYRYIIQMSH